MRGYIPYAMPPSTVPTKLDCSNQRSAADSPAWEYGFGAMHYESSTDKTEWDIWAYYPPKFVGVMVHGLSSYTYYNARYDLYHWEWPIRGRKSLIVV
ncbi:hypothetical protein PHLCEN_2v2968 [Hermanssonia centrifuga]|uniref:Uncharacterized protein n=1 Tax=Hermanssonia centrifuga TaxID=98765 RepID=A0A2R6REP9_9APHY|nr:hypothetical protein PHLCEN_2v2968 [Hermanssonia centrifuga]